MLDVVLNQVMTQKGLSARGAAKEIGVSHTTVLRALKGDPVDVPTLIAISNWIGVRPSELINSMGDVSSVPEAVSTLISTHPQLGKVFEEAVALVEKGEAGPELIEDIVSYAAYKINLAGGLQHETTDQKGGTAP